MGSRKAKDVATVIPNRIGRDGHPFRMAILPMTGMKTAAAAVFDFTFDIVIIILTIITTTIPNGRMLITESELASQFARPEFIKPETEQALRQARKAVQREVSRHRPSQADSQT